ncbi:hypothetical protein D9M68_721420 [compost metagenome]
MTTPRWRIVVLLLLIAVQFGLDRNPFGTPTSAMLSSFRLDAMLWGVLLCLFSRSELFRQYEPTFLGESGWWRLGLAAVLFFLLGAIPAQLIAMPVAVGLVALVALLLVWISSYQKGYLFCPSGLSKVLEWMGSRSYALYVIHVCAYHFSVELWSRYATAQGIALDKSFTVELALTAALFMVIGAELNHRLLEQPLRRKGAEVAQRRLQRFTGERPVAAHSTSETASRGELA